MGVAIYFVGQTVGRRELAPGESWTVGSDSGFENMAPRELMFSVSHEEVLVHRFVKPALKSGVLGRGDVVTSVNRGASWQFFLGFSSDGFQARSEAERALFDALAHEPGNRELRQVYGDWLEENGHFAEAEVLRLGDAVWRADGRLDESEYGRLGYRLRELARSLPLSWREVATRAAIVGCGRGECPRSWDKLVPKGHGVRSCQSCEKNVWFSEAAPRTSWHRRSGNRVALDVVCGRSHGADPPATETPLLGLPFFAHPDPAASIGDVMGRLRLPMPSSDRAMPADLDPPPGRALRSAFLRHRPEPCDGGYDTLQSARHCPCSEIRLTFHGDGSEVEAWLTEHFGSARATGSYRQYGHWLFRQREGHFVLWWYERLPRFMSDADVDLTLDFVREVVAILRTTSNYEAARELASRPPPRSGVIVNGDGERKTFYLGFVPALDALELAKALEIEQPRSWDDPYDMHWPLVEGARDCKRWWNAWKLDTWLAEKPRNFEALSRRDQVTGLSFGLR